MSADSSGTPGMQIKRTFEPPPDALTCFADMTQTVLTENEVVLQFYDSIPGPPEPPSGAPQVMRTRLRATVIISKQHAARLATNLGQIAANI